MKLEVAPTVPAQAFSQTIQAGIEARPAATLESAPAGRDRYRVIDTLGEGGMGRVLEASDTLFGRRIALKEMRGDAVTEESARRFLVEALVTGNLEHPGIVPVYDRGVRDGRPYYTMRKLGGRTLAEAVHGAKSPQERLALLPVLVRVAQTLAFAHERGVVHRDLKPANIVLGAHGEVTVIDWGIARVSGLAEIASEADAPAEIAAHTSVGAVMGTPSYMAPEQAAGRVDQIDARTDVFAIGAMIYEILTGKPPYAGDTAVATLAAALAAEREPLSSAARFAAPELRAICDRAMALERDARHPSAKELAAELEAYTTGAIAREEPRLLRWLVWIFGGLFAATVLVGLVATGLATSSVLEQGVPGLFVLFVTVDNLVLAFAEWRTAGRFQLLPIGVALGIGTLLIAVSGATSGASAMMRGLTGVAADAERYRMILAEGTYEIAGLVAMASLYVTVQAFVWAVAYRSARRAEARAGRAH